MQTSKILTGVAALIAAGLTAQAQYTYIPLDAPLALARFGTAAQALEASNVVGYYADSQGHNHGFLYNGLTWKTLDVPWSSIGATFALGISGSNIVGSYLTDGLSYNHGFLYNGAYSKLDDPLGTEGTIPIAIAGGSVVGFYWDSNGTAHGFLYNDNTWTTLDHPDAGSGDGYGTYVEGISGSNIFGMYRNGSVENQFVYSGGMWTTWDVVLGSTWDSLVAMSGGGSSIQFAGISGDNVVASYIDINGITNSVIYSRGVWTALRYPVVPPQGPFQTDVGIWGANIVGSYWNSSGGLSGYLAVPTIPQLIITRPSSNLSISWPYPSTGWTLMQNQDLSTTNWIPSAGVSNDGTNNFLVINASSGNLFFKLGP